jgi:mycothiol synthase
MISVMDIVPIRGADEAAAGGFLSYCRAYGDEHDESYVPDEGWAFGDDAPSFAALGLGGELVGAAAALLGPSYRAARRARIAVLHAQDEAAYAPLAAALFEALAAAADEAYLFIPAALKATRATFEGLGFRYERTAYLMAAATRAVPSAPAAPTGYRLEAVDPRDGTAVAAFVAVRNRNFAELKGSVEARVEDIAAFASSPEYLPGGLLLALAPDGSPCGTLRLERDDEEGSGFIGTIAVDKAHRGRGLARYLVRTALRLSAEVGFTEAFLSVNAENENALRLYRSEGFREVKAMDCLAARLPRR